MLFAACYAYLDPVCQTACQAIVVLFQIWLLLTLASQQRCRLQGLDFRPCFRTPPLGCSEAQRLGR